MTPTASTPHHHRHLLAALLLPILLFSAAAERTNAPPNIILIMADDLGYECIGANGCTEYETPNLDRLAAKGVRFTNGFANPLCTPSRVKIMTGQYNIRNYIKFGVLGREETTFAHQLKAAGYATAITGKWQLGREPDAAQHFGFEQSLLWQHTHKGNKRKLEGQAKGGVDNRFSNPDLQRNGVAEHYRDGEFAPDLCTDFLCNFMATNKDKPFLVYYPMILTHCPFVATPDSDDWDPNYPGSPTYKGDPKYFKDMVEYTDTLVGRIDAKLAELGIRDNTLLIFTGDNGTDAPVKTDFKTTNGTEREIPAGKGQVNDTGIRVPLIVSWPGTAKEGLVTDDLVDFTDILPTLCEASGAELPPKDPGDGVSIISTLKGETTREKPWVYFYYARKTLVRDANHGLRVTENDASFITYDGPYEEETSTIEALSDDKKAIAQRFQETTDRLLTTRRIKGPLPKR